MTKTTEASYYEVVECGGGREAEKSVPPVVEPASMHGDAQPQEYSGKEVRRDKTAKQSDVDMGTEKSVLGWRLYCPPGAT